MLKTERLHKELVLSQKEFKQLRDLVYKESGISLSDNKQSLLVSRLSKRLRALKLKTFKDYIDYVFGGSGGDEVCPLEEISKKLVKYLYS